MISLAECAPCKAKRLQEESEREFKKRFGMIDLNRRPMPMGMGWKRFMGQSPSVTTPPASAAAPSVAPPPSKYLDTVQKRLLQVGGGLLFGYPIGLLANVAFKSLRRPRNEAANFAAMAAGVGLLAALLPFPESPIIDTIARVGGLLAGSALSDVTMPKRDTLKPAARAV